MLRMEATLVGGTWNYQLNQQPSRLSQSSVRFGQGRSPKSMRLKNGKRSGSHLLAAKFWAQLGVVLCIWFSGLWITSIASGSGVSSSNIVREVLERKRPGMSVVGGRNLTRGEVNALLLALSPLRGPQKKEGMVDPKEWDPKFESKRKVAFEQWISYLKQIEDPDVMLDQPPACTTGCQVFVNHDYRFFWIKTRKTGGTSLREGLGWICEDKWLVPEGANKSFCSTTPWRKKTPNKGDPETWWKEYFVFAAVRNPYSRFASAYSFMNKMKCPKQTFGESCRDPFLKAKLCSDNHCCRSVMGIAQHMMEQSSCLFTKDGRMAVDYVVQSENLREGFAAIAPEINKRRRPGVPPLKIESIGSSNVNGNASNGYNHLFEDFPECIDYLNRFLERELRNLKYI